MYPLKPCPEKQRKPTFDTFLQVKLVKVCH